MLLGVNSLAFGQWQWLDKNGRKVFSDRAPPPEVPDKSILKRPTPVPQPDAATGTRDNDTAAPVPPPVPVPAPVSGLDKELEAKKKQTAEAEAAKRKAIEDANARVRADNCKLAKQAKANYDAGLRIGRTNANGEREFLDDTARAAERKRIQSAIETECN